jgi:hypothetical protein
LGKETFFSLELARVNAAASSFDPDGMFEVEHLMVEEIFDSAARRIRTVKDAADYDGVVGGIIVTQHATGMMSGPGERGATEETVEEASVKRLEDLVEVVVVADRGEDALAAAGLADVLGLSGDSLGGNMAAVAIGVDGRDGLLVELGQKDVSDSAVHSVRRVFEDVGKADVEATFAQADGGIERGEAAEANVERRNGRAGSKVAVLLFKDGDECGEHYASRLTRQAQEERLNSRASRA